MPTAGHLSLSQLSASLIKPQAMLKSQEEPEQIILLRSVLALFCFTFLSYWSCQVFNQHHTIKLLCLISDSNRGRRLSPGIDAKYYNWSFMTSIDLALKSGIYIKLWENNYLLFNCCFNWLSVYVYDVLVENKCSSWYVVAGSQQMTEPEKGEEKICMHAHTHTWTQMCIHSQPAPCDLSVKGLTDHLRVIFFHTLSPQNVDCLTFLLVINKRVIQTPAHYGLLHIVFFKITFGRALFRKCFFSKFFLS